MVGRGKVNCFDLFYILVVYVSDVSLDIRKVHILLLINWHSSDIIGRSYKNMCILVL